MIAIVETGGANLASLQHAFRRLGAESQVTSNAETIRRADQVILPGVGAAGMAMNLIRQNHLEATLQALNQPVLGICLGMQLLYDFSEENNTQCLGIIPGKVRQISAEYKKERITVPHMGWNSIELQNSVSDFAFSTLFEKESPYYYFVHSYQAPMDSAVKAFTRHGDKVPAIVQTKNFYGFQFHPEKSGSAGHKLLESFLSL